MRRSFIPRPSRVNWEFVVKNAMISETWKRLIENKPIEIYSASKNNNNMKLDQVKDNLIVALIESFSGANESSSVELISNTKSGKTELVIKKTIIERYPVTDYEKVIQLHHDLNRGGGRRSWSLSDMTK